MNNCQKRKRTLLERGRDVLENNRWNDCQFLVGSAPNDEVVGAHKIFLAMSSPVFETMFFGSLPEEKMPIRIPEIRAESFKALLKFIYIDELVLDRFEIIADLYYCAKKYMLPELEASCKTHVQSNLSLDAVCKGYELSEFVEESDLKAKCLQIMQTETTRILTSKSWEDVHMATVSLLFQQEVLAVDSEIELYDALLRWARAESRRKGLLDDQQSLRTVAGELVSKIRFLTLTPAQFAEGPGKGEILDKDENLALIMRISSPKVTIPVPKGFSENKKHRLHPHKDKKPDLAAVKRPLTPTADVARGTKRIGLDPNSDEKVNSPDNVPRGPCPKTKPIKPYYCHRQFTSQSDFVNDDHLYCALSFRVDKNIKICGVALSAQLPINLETRSYHESLLAYVLNADGTKLTENHFNDQVRHGNTVRIIFNSRVDIESNKNYRIGVVLNQRGTYSTIRTFASSAVCEQVNFSFNVGPENHNVRNGLIRGIFFIK